MIDTQRDRKLTIATQLEDPDWRYAMRAVAHLQDPRLLRPEQRFDIYVTDLKTATIMLAIERGVEFHISGGGSWYSPRGAGIGRNPSVPIKEMIRTGLLRDYRLPRTGQHILVPAKTHLLHERRSLCRFTGEGMGPMRSRLVDDIDLVDCWHCEAMASSAIVDE